MTTAESQHPCARPLGHLARRAGVVLVTMVLAWACLGAASIHGEAALSKAPKVRVRASPIYLWCGDPAGAACELASEAVGVMPVVPSQIPLELLDGFDDVENDCEQPEMTPLIHRISRALDLDATGWADQVGRTLPVDMVSERYQGGGCITMADGRRPTVKIHGRISPSPPTFLIRVWEREGQ